MPAVERLGVDAAQPAHAIPKRRRSRLNDEVVVVRHQAIGQALPLVTLRGRLQFREEEPAFVITVENGLPTISALGYVVDRAVEFGSCRSSHTSKKAS